MARAFGNSYLNYLERSASLISDIDPRPLSVHCWLKANNNNVMQWIFNNNITNNPTWGCGCRPFDAVDVLFVYTRGYKDSNSPFTLSTTAWTQLGWSQTGTAAEFYVNGAATGTATAGFGGITTDGALIGSLDGQVSGFDIDGDLAEFAVWNAILTPNEWAALGANYSPLFIRPQSLVSYLPIFGRNSPEPDRVDPLAWTVNGTLTVAPHAPMLYPAPPHLPFFPPAPAPPPGWYRHMAMTGVSAQLE